MPHFWEHFPHPEGVELDGSMEVAPILGYLPSRPFYADIVESANRCFPYLSAVSLEAAQDLRTYVLELAYASPHQLSRVSEALSWLAMLFPLCPLQGVVDSYFPLQDVHGQDMCALVNSLRQTAMVFCKLQTGEQQTHTIFECMRSVAATIKQKKDSFVSSASEWWYGMLDSILAKVRAPFVSILAPYLATAQRFKDEIENFWDGCVLWAKNLWKQTHIAVQALGAYAIWATIVMILVGIMYIIETMLMAMGILSTHGVLVSIFTGVLFAVLGYTVYTMGKEYISFLQTLRQIILYSVIPDASVNEAAGVTSPEIDGAQNAHSFFDTAMAPVHFLESIASGLSFFSSNSVTVLGKLGNSLEGIRKGYRCLTDFLSMLFDAFGNAFEHVSGKRTSFFRDLACAVKVDVKKWTEDARKLIEYFEIAGSLDRFEYYRVRELIYQGQDMMDAADKGRSSQTSSNFLRTVGKLVENLKDVRAKCARSLKFPGWRRQPFWVYTFGESQCGKSTMANYLMPMLLTHLGCDPNDVYSKDPVDGYWSGYYQQKGLKMNDLSAVVPKNVTCLEQQLIPLISTEEKLVSSAEIEGKGVQFLSEVIVSSSNVSDAPTGAEILDKDAYRLRRKAVLRCRRAVEWVHDDKGKRTERLDVDGKVVTKQYDPSDALACTEVQWVHPVTFNALEGPRGEWHLADHTIQMVKEAMDSHFQTEDAKMSAWKDSLGMHSHTARLMTSYLQDMIKAIGCWQNTSGQCGTNPRKILVAVDGKAYELDAAGNALELKQCDNVEDIERQTKLNYRIEFSRAVYSHTTLTYEDSFHASMVRDFLDDMLENGASVSSVKEISSSSKPMHKDLWKELTLSNRIFLRVSQVALNDVRDAPHFKEHITNTYLESMRLVRDAIVDNKEKILLFLCAVTLVGLTAWGFFSAFKAFTSGSMGFGAGLALKNQLAAHSSVMSSGSVTSAFAQRNVPIVWGKAARYAQAHSQLEDAGSFDYIKDGMAHMLCRVVGTSGQSETGLLFGPRSVAICAHQLRMFPDGDRVTIHYLSHDRIPQCFSFTWHYINAIEWPDCEVMVYRDDQLTPLPVYNTNNYLRGEQKLPTVININGVAIKKRKFFDEKTLTAGEKTLDGETLLIRSWSDVATLCTSVQTITGPNYRRDINRYYTSTYPAGVHDSGGLITTMHNGRRVVVGLHCAGKQEGYLYKSTIGLLPTGDISEAHSSPDFFVPSSGREEKGFCKIGWISNPAKRPHTGAKTALAPVDPLLALPLPHGVQTKIPSILSKKDERLKTEVNPEFKDYDPLKDGMSKFANPMALLDEDILSAVCEDVYQTWYDALPIFDDEKQFLEKTSLDVALNGIPGEACYDAMRMDTSEGYPYVLERQPGESGKARYINIDDDGFRTLIPGTSVARDYEELACNIFKHVPVLNCVECPKDELLKPSKVLEKPGTRLFDTLPFVHNLLLREYFLNFCVFLQHNRLRLPCSVGINPYSREWTWLFDRLASKSDRALNCDYSKFDGLISHQVYMQMVSIINRLFKDGEEANLARRNLFLMFTSRRSICYDQVYMVTGGMPSGCALTVIINSVLNEILVRYVYRKVTPQPARNYFNKYVELVVYGDDNLIAIHDDVVDYFDGPIIKEEMAKVGVTITDGTDKLSPTLVRKPLESLDFLKRGFRKGAGGLYSAPLDKTSLYSRLFYTTGGADGKYQNDILHDNIKSFLEEITLHGEYSEFQRVRNFYVARVPSWSATLPSWSHCIDFMEGQLNAATPWQPHKFIETRPHGGEEKMMAGQDKHDQRIVVTPRLIVCGEKYRPPINEASFIVSIDNPLYPNERGISVRTEVDRGSGHLPMDRWSKDFSSIKRYPTLHQAYEDGATIYFKSRMPYFWSWCALCKFAQSKGINQSSVIALYEKYKPSNAGDIAPLVADKAYTKYVARPMFDFSGIREKIVT
ncbi:polyprotein [Potato virus U]|uniref:RNA1 polyprotein n=1 Tax=Potato virus U TaxID=2170039 RepID=A0A494RBR4_9SECO|nr:polyprotein [Potato virus U]AYF57455.1 polyprotein [Potato virus U]